MATARKTAKAGPAGRQPQKKQPPSAEDIVEGIVGGGGGGSTGGSSGGSSGGTSSGGTSSGGSTGPTPAQVAAEKQKAKEKARKEQMRELRRQQFEQRREAAADLRNMLVGMGLPIAPFNKLIKATVKQGIQIKKKKIINKVGPNILLNQIAHTAKFQAMFPGINTYIEGGADPAQAVGMYKDAQQKYALAAKNLGYAGDLGKDKIAALITGGVDPTEFAERLQAFGALQANAGVLETLNQAAAAQGLAGLDEQGKFNFLMGLGAAEYYDLYEGLFFTQQGINSETARALARSIGAAGSATDLSALPDAINALKGEAGQEFAQIGIGQEELVLASMSEFIQGDPTLKARADQAKKAIEQQLKNINARRQVSSAAQPQQTQGGRPVLPGAPQEQLASI